MSWLKYLDMVRFDCDELQAILKKCFMDKREKHVLEYRSGVLSGKYFRTPSSNRVWSRLTRKLLVLNMSTAASLCTWIPFCDTLGDLGYNGEYRSLYIRSKYCIVSSSISAVWKPLKMSVEEKYRRSRKNDCRNREPSGHSDAEILLG